MSNQDGINGEGIYTFPDGTKYVGEFKDNKPNGQGTEIYPDGEKYEGEWKNGKKCGYGIYSIPDGGKYEGEWKDNMFDGKGTETFLMVINMKGNGRMVNNSPMLYVIFHLN